MSYFAVQVWTGMEARFLSIYRKRGRDRGAAIIWPRRSLRIRHSGIWRDTLAPIFPGYMFIKAERVDPELYWEVKRTPGFVHFLLSNDHIVPLDDRDQGTLAHFLTFGEIVDKSQVFFDENKKIRVVSGPLKGLEGSIVRVDRRKGRAKVRLELYENSFEVDFGFDALESAPVPALRQGET